MKSVALVVLICTQLCWCKNPYPKAVVPLQPAVREKCIAETGASLDMIKNCEEGNFANDRALMCYSGCVNREFGIVKPDGTVDAEMLAGVFGPDEQKYAEIVRKCAGIDSGDACEISYLTHKCYFEKFPEGAFYV